MLFINEIQLRLNLIFNSNYISDLFGRSSTIEIESHFFAFQPQCHSKELLFRREQEFRITTNKYSELTVSKNILMFLLHRACLANGLLQILPVVNN